MAWATSCPYWIERASTSRVMVDANCAVKRCASAAICDVAPGKKLVSTVAAALLATIGQ
jgi:hypothetical protein